MYNLENNVYIVKGYKDACIYDLNNQYLYHINKQLYDWINFLITNEELENYDDEEKKILVKLLESNIIKKDNIIQEAKITLEEHKIDFAWIEVTTKCNLKCIHCYEESDLSCTKEMSMEDYILTIERLKKYGIKKIQLIGGEPFMLGSRLKDMLIVAVSNFESVEVFTNGTMLTEEWAKFLKDNNIKIAISLYSYKDNEHDKVTGIHGSHKLTNVAITLLNKYNIKYRVCNVLMKNVDVGEKNTTLYTLSYEKDIVRMSGRANMSLLSKELIRKKLIVKDSFSNKLNVKLFNKLCKGHNCFSSKIYISTSLDVYPCVMERRISHGILKDKELDDLLKEDIINLGKDCIEECKDCEYRLACFDCRANSISDNVYKKPWYCTYNPYKGEWEDADKFIEKLIKEVFDEKV